MIDELLERFTQNAPVATMVRAMLVNVLSADRIDAVFRRTAVVQCQRELLFSSVVDLLHLAVLKTKPSVHAAYKSRKQALGVSIAAVYDKLAGVELAVSRELLRTTSKSMLSIWDALSANRQTIIPGYEVRILDGSHLAATERRLKGLRSLNGAPLPGQALVILDPQRMLIEDMIPCEDGHTQERLILHELIDELCPGIVWIADRNFCTAVWLLQVAISGSWFINRRHSQMSLQEQTPLKRIGRTSTGMVFEQQVFHETAQGDKLVMRRIVLELDQPTADGDTRIEILTNLPAEVSALVVVDAYKERWTIEGAFGDITISLHGEINTLAYPPAAILAYTLALISYNVLTIVKAAVAATQGDEVAASMSAYHMAEEISSTDRGMTIAISMKDWERRFSKLDPLEMALELKRMAKQVELRRYRKTVRGTKKLQPDRQGTRQHVSTQKILNQQKAKDNQKMTA